MLRNVLIVVSMLFIGCAGMMPQPSVCESPEAEASFICEKCSEAGVTVEDIDLVFQIAAVRLLEGQDKEAALKFFDAVEVLLDKNATYRALIEFVKSEIGMVGPEVLLISRYFPMFDSTRYISKFDKWLILTHIENQRVILGVR